MTSSTQPRHQAGYFQWNAGAWFGSTLGGTAWMLIVSGFLLANQQPGLAAIPLGCFVVTNLVSYLLWERRHHLAPFPALMMILSLLAVLVPLAWFSTAAWGSRESLVQMNWPASSGWNVAVILLCPVMMSWFWLMEHCEKRRYVKASHSNSLGAP